MRQPSYGEIAFNTYKALRNDSVSAVWDNQSQAAQDTWENIAAVVLAEYHKRQAALGRQSQQQEQTQPGGTQSQGPRLVEASVNIEASGGAQTSS
jgi:hypothetical protein